MTKQWRPHVDLARLSTALSEEVLAAAEWDVRRLHAETGYSITAAAQHVREVIAAASGDQEGPDPAAVGSGRERRTFVPC